jgi:putative nucleotidyltransferase with HDIG domain
MAAIPNRARPFVFLVCVGGLVCLITGLFPWSSGNILLFASYFLLCALASVLKIAMRGQDGTVSVNFVFFLIGICSMTLSETLALALIATIVQCFWPKPKHIGFAHFLFNLSQITLGITAAYWTYWLFVNHILHGRAPLALLLAAVVYFLLNSMVVATVVALAETSTIAKKWTSYSWTFPYYLVGAAIAGVIQVLNRVAGWEMGILVLPAVYVIYRSYRMQRGRWDDEKRHLQDIASLHMRTIETLALAIEAKDHTTGDHLQRVRVYAMELAKDLGLTEPEQEALKAASVLHDIGKLAVPEHIISKPGKLTPEEFEKMKVHPIVGAEILEQINFPYPVAPVVRSHHEKWDGTGYPDGLAGEAIPIGARILSAVDCLDALASDRQYRRALPLGEAMAHVERDSGKAFDPRVVAALKSRYIELEQLARSQQPEERRPLSVDVKVDRGAAPDAGFEPSSNGSPAPEISVPASAFTSQAEEGVTLEEALSAATVRLRHVLSYDAMAVYVISKGFLKPHFVLGENMRQLSSLRVRSGQGLIGWVAETGNTIVNGNPTVEPGFMESIHGNVVLRSALAAPLLDGTRVVGVLALYRLEPDAFTNDHLHLLQLSQYQLGNAVARHLEIQQLQRMATGVDTFDETSHGFELALGATRSQRPV